MVTVTLEAGGAGTYTQRAIPRPEPRSRSIRFPHTSALMVIRQGARTALRSGRRLRPPAPSCLPARAAGGIEVKRSQGRCAVRLVIAVLTWTARRGQCRQEEASHD